MRYEVRYIIQRLIQIDMNTERWTRMVGHTYDDEAEATAAFEELVGPQHPELHRLVRETTAVEQYVLLAEGKSVMNGKVVKQ
jgi:hypothetical protein